MYLIFRIASLLFHILIFVYFTGLTRDKIRMINT